MNTSDDLVKKKIFYRRTFIVGAVQLFAFFALFLRFGFMQIFQRRKYMQMADNNRYRSQITMGMRGEIMDRNGLNIATNRTQYRAILDSTTSVNIDLLLSKFATIVKVSDKEFYIRQIKKKIALNQGQNIAIHPVLSRQQLFDIELNLVHLRGISILGEQMRFYPFGKYTSHLTGYIGRPVDDVLNCGAACKKMYNNSDIKVGLTGMEKVMDDDLRGDFGILFTEVDATGNIFGSVMHKKHVAGKNIYTTIDLDLQNFVASLLESVIGCVTVLDVSNGDVLAMHSSPCFDPNKFLYGVSNKSWQELDKLHPGTFINKNIAMLYPPGSTFKIVSILAALSNGIDPKSTFFCTGKYRLGNRTFHCHKENGHGEVDMMSAVAQSCNCYFYNLATNISIESMAECAHILGLDSSSALFLGKESFGIMPSKKWKYENFGTKWTMGDTFNTIIGQGYVEMSPMQLVVMIARVASGKILTPSIFLSHSKNVATLKDLNIDKNCLQILRRALREVFSSPSGLCRYHDSRDPKYMIAGKTGTAQVVSRRIKHHANEKNKFIAHALFVGYVPFLDPKFAISAIVEHGASGTSATALAKKILHFAVDKSKN